MELKVLQQDLGRQRSGERQAGGDVAPCCLQLLHRLQLYVHTQPRRETVCAKKAFIFSRNLS